MPQIIVNITRPMRFGTTQLVPGGNEVSQEVYDRLMALSSFKRRVDGGAVTVSGGVDQAPKRGRGRPPKPEVKTEPDPAPEPVEASDE